MVKGILIAVAALVVLSACGASATPTPMATPRQNIQATGLELDSAMKANLLALANDRDAWFLASVVTTETLKGLYDSWSLVCRNKTSLSDYKEAVYGHVRPVVLAALKIDLEDARKADRYYKVESWNPPWAYVQQIWEIDGEIILGPERQLFLVESGAWRYHDC